MVTPSANIAAIGEPEAIRGADEEHRRAEEDAPGLGDVELAGEQDRRERAEEDAEEERRARHPGGRDRDRESVSGAAGRSAKTTATARSGGEIVAVGEIAR